MDINHIWKSQTVPHPDLEAFYAKVVQFKTKRLRKLWIANGLLLFTVLFVVTVGYVGNPQNMTTWAGIGLVVLSIVLYLIMYNKMLPLYRSLDGRLSNHEYMETLLQIKQRELELGNRMLNLYFLFLSIGIALYMLEFVRMMDLKWGIIVYAVTFLWFIYNWLVLRPKQILKSQKAIHEVIDRLKALNGTE